MRVAPSAQKKPQGSIPLHSELSPKALCLRPSKLISKLSFDADYSKVHHIVIMITCILLKQWKWLSMFLLNEQKHWNLIKSLTRKKYIYWDLSQTFVQKLNHEKDEELKAVQKRNEELQSTVSRLQQELKLHKLPETVRLSNLFTATISELLSGTRCDPEMCSIANRKYKFCCKIPIVHFSVILLTRFVLSDFNHLRILLNFWWTERADENWRGKRKPCQGTQPSILWCKEDWNIQERAAERKSFAAIQSLC